MSNDESNCRSASMPEPALGKESSVGWGTVSCGMFAARAAAAVEGDAFARCWAMCWLMLVSSLEVDERKSFESVV